VTSGDFQGMDTDYARQAAHSMDGGVSSIHGVVGNIGNLLGSTPWFGRYASQFVEDWHGSFTTQLNGVTSSLGDNAQVLRQRAQMQDEASGS
jgi:hypothetical protein